uniref:Uncharacterized protein n=1 Tax=Setaria italica TaxID=4555 RepID=K3YF57_SETIT
MQFSCKVGRKLKHLIFWNKGVHLNALLIFVLPCTVIHRLEPAELHENCMKFMSLSEIL